MAADKLMEWKVLPRIMTIMFTIMAWRCAEWFMNLPDPNAVQAGFVSVVMGAMTGAFAIWMGNEARK
jgi:hypothetical protein|tara:strand:- start:91 stop:291 length:201 start_codon:yes stop_codon:yes gene_type:complete